MVTVHSSFGYGVKITPQQQPLLEKMLLDKFRSSEHNSDLRSNVWFTETAEDLFLYDALEEFYEDVLILNSQSSSSDDANIIITTASSTLDFYNPNFSESFDSLPNRGTSEELKALHELTQLLNSEAKWVFVVSTFL